MTDAPYQPVHSGPLPRPGCRHFREWIPRRGSTVWPGVTEGAAPPQRRAAPVCDRHVARAASAGNPLVTGRGVTPRPICPSGIPGAGRVSHPGAATRLCRCGRSGRGRRAAPRCAAWAPQAGAGQMVATTSSTNVATVTGFGNTARPRYVSTISPLVGVCKAAAQPCSSSQSSRSGKGQRLVLDLSQVGSGARCRRPRPDAAAAATAAGAG